MGRKKQPRLASVEEALYGKEPMPIQGASDQQVTEYLQEAMHFYTYAVLADQKKKWFLEFLNDSETVVTNVDDSHFAVAGALARIWSLGTHLPKHEKKLQEFREKFEAMGAKIAEEKAAKKALNEAVKARQRAAENDSVIGKIEYVIDQISSGELTKFDFAAFCQQNKVSAENQEAIKNRVKPLLAELGSKDEDIVEAYAFMGKRKIVLAQTLGSIVGAEEIAVSLPRTTRRPRKVRKPRAVNPLKAVSRLKYSKSAEVEGKKLVSVDPKSLVGAEEAWVFNTKYRILSRYVAKSGGLQVKGTSLKNLDETQSMTKKLRKPVQTIEQVMSAGKVQRRKIMPDLTTKEIKVTGRINEDTILLKVVG